MKITIIQSSKWKKSSGRLLATNWRNLVTRCKFLVASLYNVNDTNHSIRACFWYLARSRSHEININPRNITKFARNLIKYMPNIIETCLGYWDCLIAVNLQIYLETSSPQRANNIPKLPLVMMLKALPLAHFLTALLLKQQMIISVKNIKHAHQISTKSADFKWNLPRKFPQNRLFFIDCFLVKLAQKIFKNLFLKILRNQTSASYQKCCSMVWSIRFGCLKISQTEVSINLQVNWLCLCDLTHFLWCKAKQDKMECLF